MVPRKLILGCGLCPGDIVTLTAAVRDLHLSHPGKFVTDVRTPCPALWEHNPYITPLQTDDPGVECIEVHYPLIHEANQAPYHFIHGYRLFLEEHLGVRIRASAFKGDIPLALQEKAWMSQVDEITQRCDTRFWIVVNGGKYDYTAKWWAPARMQAVVDHFAGRLQFVQVGEAGHYHPPLSGVINLVGKTDLRQLVRLVYHADGVICPVTSLMHLAAAVETKPGRWPARPCVVLAGGREPDHWEHYPGHRYLSSVGFLSCCHSGGCWRSRVVPKDEADTDNACVLPVEQPDGSKLPRCLDRITAEDVIAAVEGYVSAEGN